MNVLISGASGVVGRKLCSDLRRAGHNVVPLTRGGNWRVESGRIEPLRFDPDAVIHLAGENIFGRWSEERKRAIYDSRVRLTRKLCGFLGGLERPPRVFICASAVGIYGDRGDEVLTEYSELGDDFLARVCKDWEAATEPLSRTSCRVISTRLGIVLSRDGGAVAKMLPMFRAGLGGPLGSGKQWMSWVAIDDLSTAIQFLLESPSASSPFNVTSPNPVQNREFGRILGKVLKRPSFLPAPGFALRIAFGEMADAALLASQRAEPGRLEELGFRFEYPELELALRHVLQRE